jgi:3-dehydroquinate synthase
MAEVGIGPFARKRNASALAVVVSDENVKTQAQATGGALASAGFETRQISLPPGEETKSFATLTQLYDRLAEWNADRRTLIVAVGGGVIGDLAGFAAATFNRGLPLLMAPTTLLAMVDSSVGGKVGINHPRGKNLIGAFHQPIGVWIDTAALATLPDRDYRSGLAEVAKYGVTLDAKFFGYLEENATSILKRDESALRHIVAHSCRLKARVVEQDEREEIGLRAVLNYGHTFAHAFETVAGYGAWLHGEAVAAGMACAARLAVHRGLLSTDVAERQQRLLQRLGLPSGPSRWPISELLDVMRRDKKAVAGRLRLVLPRRLGEAALFEDIPESLVQQVLEELMAESEISQGTRP